MHSHLNLTKALTVPSIRANSIYSNASIMAESASISYIETNTGSLSKIYTDLI